MSEYRTPPPLEVEAAQNFEELKQMPYPGRVVVSGVSDRGLVIQIVALMGRSDTSRNRVLVDVGNGTIKTAPVDPNIPVDPLTMYNAMAEENGVFIASNGAQTDTILQAAHDHRAAESGLQGWAFEPDPSHTPRISTFYYSGNIAFSILREDQGALGETEYEYQRFTAQTPGLGHIIQTCEGDGGTSSYRGSARPIPLKGSPDRIATVYWHALNQNNRVALALKAIDPYSGERYQTVVINTHTVPQIPTQP